MSTKYEADIVAWAQEQSQWLRAGRFDLLDLGHLAEEIEDVGKSEQRELASRMAVLLMHLLKWHHQPERQGSSWARAIKEQRKRVLLRLRNTPSLSRDLQDPIWWGDVWADAVASAIQETGLDVFPEDCPWAVDDLLQEGWLPTP
jgi:hypothetical protein